MRNLKVFVVFAAVSLVLVACDSDDAVITTTTADASQLTTTTTSPDSEGSPDDTTAPDTTAPEPSDPISEYDIISRQSSPDGETLYIEVAPGDYSDVSVENFLGDLLADDPAIFGVEVFDDRAAIDAALKPEDERTADELQAIEDHHLVSLKSGSQVQFKGPMSGFDDFVIGS